MHTISSLRKSLGLATTNQVRNRIESIRELLAPHLRRGPNNQLLVTDEGLALLRQLQELYDSGLRMTEASDVLKSKSVYEASNAYPVSYDAARNQTRPTEDTQRLIRSMQEEIAFLRARVVALEDQLLRDAPASAASADAWWTRLREDVDVS